MYLKNLALVHFKNYQQVELEFSPRINCFVGNNGVGKTNLLDAIHYLSLTKSFFNPIDSQNIRHGEEFFVVQGDVEKDGKTENLYCACRKSRKKQFKKNRKEYERLADHIGYMPVVMISPADSALITEGSDQRRKFMDSVISQYDRVYLDNLMRYNRALTQRNILLKQMSGQRQTDHAAIDLWDKQLIPLAASIYQTRVKFISDLMPLFREYYAMISGNEEEVELRYESQLHEKGMDELLRERREKDLAVQYTTGGVHKDDLWLGLGEHPMKRTGSQGQQKTFLVALKLAKFGFIYQVSGNLPILLLDDIFDKFDKNRVKQIIRLVSEKEFGQIFITDTNLEHLEGILKEIPADYRIFTINDTVRLISQ